MIPGPSAHTPLAACPVRALEALGVAILLLAFLLFAPPVLAHSPDEGAPPQIMLVPPVPDVILCRRLPLDRRENGFFYLGLMEPAAVHYYRDNDRLSYHPESGAFISQLHAQNWDCADEALSLTALTAQGRAFSTLRPFTGLSG